jgi:hypothetical protein
MSGFPQKRMYGSSAQGGGAVPAGAANELQKNNGAGAFSGTGIFSTTDGNILLGAAAGAGGTRSIAPQGSAATIQLALAAKGNTVVSITGATLAIIGVAGERIDVNAANMTIINTKSVTDKTLKLAAAAGLNGIAVPNGDSVQIIGGNADQAAGNGNGGNVYITPGDGRGTGLNGNIGLFTIEPSYGNGENIIKILKTSTPASALVADSILLWAEDSSDGTATLAMFTEQAVEAIGVFTPSHKLKIKINGVEYWIELDAV